MKQSNMRSFNGFTIVELLIAIVIIGILAAITVISYNGIQDRASQSLLQSDLRQIATELKLSFVDSGQYPLDASELEHGDGVSLYYTSDGSTYCLTAIHDKASLPYHVSNDGSVREGACAGHSVGNDGSDPGMQVFTSSGTFIPPSGVSSVDVLIVGGGGSGGAAGSRGGGGGGGQVRWREDVSVSGPVAVTVGAGGARVVTGPSAGSNGQPSSFGSITAIGGGGGGGGNGNGPTVGASGGGGAGHNGGAANVGAEGTAGGRGGNGGSSQYDDPDGAGGGGGAGGDGTNAERPNRGGDGGRGVNMSEHVGTSVGDNGWFGGGGGGGVFAGLHPGSGRHGGGDGGSGTSPEGGGHVSAAEDGIPNTGGGGGGSPASPAPNRVSGAGGSGVVIVVWGDDVANASKYDYKPDKISKVIGRVVSWISFYAKA